MDKWYLQLCADFVFAVGLVIALNNDGLFRGAGIAISVFAIRFIARQEARRG